MVHSKQRIKSAWISQSVMLGAQGTSVRARVRACAAFPGIPGV